MMNEPFFSLGCGDRFGREGEAQLAAFIEAKRRGVLVSPAWNKSNREHKTVHTAPASVRQEADAAVKKLQWDAPYFVDADHISLSTVDGFIESSDFFTLDVADNIGEAAAAADIEAFVESMKSLKGGVHLSALDERLVVSEADVRRVAERYLRAVRQAGKIYRHIAGRKTSPFMVEVSMDETNDPQTPVEILLILAMIAQEKIPLDTIAPKFSGRFNKGVDYVGDPATFEKEFEQDIAVLRHASEHLGFKPSLRLSLHSGSDKFAIYPGINRILRKHHAGLHVKTAGTTWLEEVVGLAEAGGSGLAVAKKIYAQALGRHDELSAPYAAVIDIDPNRLPSVDTVDAWGSREYVEALRHDQGCPSYNAHFRQLIHVAYKVAYDLGDEYFSVLDEHRVTVAKNVTYNLLNRHLLPLFH